MDSEKTYKKQFFYGPVFYNFLFIFFQLAYNYFFRNMLLGNSIKTLYEVRKAPVLGVIILTAAAAGTYAIMMTCRILRSDGVKSPSPAAFVLCVLNWVLSIHMIFTALQSFGVVITKDYDLLSNLESALLNISIFVVLIQSAFLAGFIVRLSVPYERTISRSKIIAKDISAFYFTCVSYTVLWETIMYKSVSVNGRYDILTASGAFNIFGWIICFILLYPPMRFPYIVQELHDTSENKNIRIQILSYILVIITGVIPLIQ